MRTEHRDDGFHPVALNLKAALDEARQRPGFEAAWNELSEEYETLNALLHARKDAGLTQEDVAAFQIPDGELLEGALPVKQFKLVQAWMALHADELMADWKLAAAGATPYKIDPLK